jgi:hypothetical protein
LFSDVDCTDAKSKRFGTNLKSGFAPKVELQLLPSENRGGDAA